MLVHNAFLGSLGTCSYLSELLRDFRTKELIKLSEQSRIAQPSHKELSILIYAVDDSNSMEDIKHHIHQVIIQGHLIKYFHLLK